MRKIVAIVMAICISLGMTNSVYAKEVEKEAKTEVNEEINLLEQPYVIYDADGNIVNKARLSTADAVIPAGGYVGWYVTIYNGRNSINVNVNPDAKLKISLCNGLKIEQYSYTTTGKVAGTSSSFNNPGRDATGLLFVYNLSNYSTTVTKATFAGQ